MRTKKPAPSELQGAGFKGATDTSKHTRKAQKPEAKSADWIDSIVAEAVTAAFPGAIVGGV